MPFMPRPSTAGGVRGIGNIEFPSISTPMALGFTFAVAGNVLISFALNLQKLAHARLEAARAKRGNGLNLIEQEGAASTDGEVSEADLQREACLPPELEREARVWNGNSYDATLHLGPRSETDPLMALPVTPEAGQILASTYGAILPNTSGNHARPIESSPLRQRPKIAELPGTGVADDHANQPIHQGLNYEAQESEYLKSKLWYALPSFLRTARA
jgi:magnesium transporter